MGKTRKASSKAIKPENVKSISCAFNDEALGMIEYIRNIYAKKLGKCSVSCAIRIAILECYHNLSMPGGTNSQPPEMFSK
jgi:hypothetical protein